MESEVAREREGQKEQARLHREQLQRERERLAYTRENRLTDDLLNAHLGAVTISLREMQQGIGAQFPTEFERFAAMYMAL